MSQIFFGQKIQKNSHCELGAAFFWPLASPPKPFFHFRKQENHLTNKDEARRPSSNATFTFGPSLLAPAIRRFRYVWNFSISRGPLHEGSIREAAPVLRFLIHGKSKNLMTIWSSLARPRQPCNLIG